MKNIKLKRTVSIIMSVIMIVLFFVPAFAEDNSQNLPIIVVNGFGNMYLEKTDDKSVVYPTQITASDILKDKSIMTTLLTELGFGRLTGNYSVYNDDLVKTITPIYEDIKLDKDGNSKENISTLWGNNTAGYNGEYGLYTHIFNYDFRLSPNQTAEELNEYINRVRLNNNFKKVVLVGRCYGACVVQSYLNKYGSPDILDSVIYYIPSIAGSEAITTFFTGEANFDSKGLSKFVDSYLTFKEDLAENEIVDFFVELVNLLNTVEGLGISTNEIQIIYENIKNDAIPRILRESYGSFPSVWAMVTPDRVEDAIKYVFGGCEEEYAGLIDIIRDYRDNVQLTSNDIISAYNEETSIKFYNISKYNIEPFPARKNANEQSDGFFATSNMSFGATCAEKGKTLSDEYIQSLESDLYLSADKKIDASTCLLPDTTFFIKDCFHNDYADYIQKLILKIAKSKNLFTIFSDGSFPQYVKYNSETKEAKPVTTLDTETSTNSNQLNALFNWVISLVNLLVKLIGNYSSTSSD